MAREDLKHADLLHITEGSFLNNMNGLIINFRKTEANELNAAGTKVKNGQQEITLLLTRQAQLMHTSTWSWLLNLLFQITSINKKIISLSIVKVVLKLQI